MTINEFISKYILPYIPNNVEGNKNNDDNSNNSNSENSNDNNDSDDINSEQLNQNKRQKIIHILEEQDNSTIPKGYLAQHCLFDHIPLLKSHFVTPDYCCLLSEEDEAIEQTENIDQDNIEDVYQVLVNGWFGPIGTISPLHHDPYHNILAQVHGLILLFTLSYRIF